MSQWQLSTGEYVNSPANGDEWQLTFIGYLNELQAAVAGRIMGPIAGAGGLAGLGGLAGIKGGLAG